jgi:DNA-binding NarL/FixJ family response regulator
MLAIPVLIVTHDDAVWQHWRGIDNSLWLPARGHGLPALTQWRDRGHWLVILDAGLPALPAWVDPTWPARMQGLRLVVGSSRPSDEEGRRVLAAGASAYVHAYSPASVLDRVLTSVKSGDVWLGRSLLTRLLKDIEQRLPAAGSDWMQGLTVREQEVARYVAIGKSNQDIADLLGISERTVRAHLSAVFEKLDVTDRLFLALKVHGIQ